MREIEIETAFLWGIGAALGCVMAERIFRFMKPPSLVRIQLILCMKCGQRNPMENKFCNECGQAIYPPPRIRCPRCDALIAADTKFCGSCGSPNRKQKKVENEEDRLL